MQDMQTALQFVVGNMYLRINGNSRQKHLITTTTTPPQATIQINLSKRLNFSLAPTVSPK
jgi:hypothetical protein